MKNKGYALSAIVYPLLLVCLVLILSILFNLNNKKNLLNSLKDEVKNEVAFVNKIPTAPIITGGSTNWSSSAKTISVSKQSTAMSGINNYQYCISTSTNGCDGTWTDLASGTTSTSISTNGIRYIYFRAISKSGREGQSSLYQTTMIDTEGPSVPTTGTIGNVSGTNTTGTIQTEASGSTDSESGDITYKYLVTNTNTTPSKDDEGFTTSKTFTRSCGTTYYAWAIAEDALGNRSEVVSLGNTSDGANSYSAWGSCSKTCGGGTQTRTNTCALVTTDLSQACNTQSCNYAATNSSYTGTLVSNNYSAPTKTEICGGQMYTDFGSHYVHTCRKCGYHVSNYMLADQDSDPGKDCNVHYQDHTATVYYCPYGGTLSGSTCLRSSYTCPNGGTLSGSTCILYTCPNGGTLNNSNKMCEF